jgi:hypothetical protein
LYLFVIRNVILFILWMLYESPLSLLNVFAGATALS